MLTLEILWRDSSKVPSAPFQQSFHHSLHKIDNTSDISFLRESTSKGLTCLGHRTLAWPCRALWLKVSWMFCFLTNTVATFSLSQEMGKLTTCTILSHQVNPKKRKGKEPFSTSWDLSSTATHDKHISLMRLWDLSKPLLLSVLSYCKIKCRAPLWWRKMSQISKFQLSTNLALHDSRKHACDLMLKHCAAIGQRFAPKLKPCLALRKTCIRKSASVILLFFKRYLRDFRWHWIESIRQCLEFIIAWSFWHEFCWPACTSFDIIGSIGALLFSMLYFLLY